MRETARQAARLDSFTSVSCFELQSYMVNTLLRDTDAASMANSLEVRVPFLDHRLVELVASMPGSSKQADSRPKPLLLDAVGPRLPTFVYTRGKQGFTFPWDDWLRGPLRQRATLAMREADVWRALGIDPQGPSYLWRRFEGGDRRVAALQGLALLVLAD